ncbi:MAG: hypothetical protein WKF59_13950 [Chitinophagaceae bacterium]
MKRILSIDITRGLIMIIMALDHVRDLMHVNSITQSPTNLSTTSPALFLPGGSPIYVHQYLYSWQAHPLIYLLKTKTIFHKAETFYLREGCG